MLVLEWDLHGMRVGKQHNVNCLRRRPSLPIFLVLSIVFFVLAIHIFRDNRLPVPPMQVDMADEELFWRGDSIGRKTAEHEERNIIAGVIPHHAVGSELISDFFIRAQKTNPKRIILLGPSHFELQSSRIFTADVDWESGGRTLQTESSLVHTFISNKLGVVDTGIVKQEHAITTLIPYVSYYLPDASVFSIVITPNVPISQLDLVSDMLAKKIGKNTLLVASVDFSHYLDSEQATTNDALTLDVIQRKDWEQLLRLNSDYLDGPKVLYVLFETMRKVGKNNIELLGHSNSKEILGTKDSQGVTSYFELGIYSD